jgi:hypothetical protein
MCWSVAVKEEGNFKHEADREARGHVETVKIQLAAAPGKHSRQGRVVKFVTASKSRCTGRIILTLF